VQGVRVVSWIAAAFIAFAACASFRNSAGVGHQPGQSAETAEKPGRKIFKLEAEDFWRMEAPGGRRFDASGLTWDGKRLLVIDDRAPEAHEVDLATNHVAKLKPAGIFTWPQMTTFLGRHGRFDIEGVTHDEQGRIYVCEESSRSVFRYDPAAKKVERLEIDWTPVRKYFSGDDNASFEGIAVGGGKLWLANERERARIIEVDLQTLKVVGDFVALPSTWGIVLHYSDLCWFKGKLFLLLRHQRVILEIDPTTREVLAEYNYHAIEDAPEHEYHKEYPTGTMEGLAVDDHYFWLCTDNNGLPRVKDNSDRRPTLFKCKRPE
jgi:hypothetical protein